MDAMTRLILVGLDDAMADIETRPAVPTHAPWWRRERDEAERADGPLWQPSVLLADADGEPVPDRVRVAAWRAVKRLERLGYVVIVADGGRHRVRLTDAGRSIIDDDADPAVPAVDAGPTLDLDALEAEADAILADLRKGDDDADGEQD